MYCYFEVLYGDDVVVVLLVVMVFVMEMFGIFVNVKIIEVECFEYLWCEFD